MRLFASLAALVLLAGCMGGGDSSEATGGTSTTTGMGTSPAHQHDSDADVEIYDNIFHPSRVNTTAGTTLHFLNAGASRHTVTVHRVTEPVSPPRFDRELDTGQEAEYTFDLPGTYHVWCRFHGEMTSGMAMVVQVT